MTISNAEKTIKKIATCVKTNAQQTLNESLQQQ